MNINHELSKEMVEKTRNNNNKKKKKKKELIEGNFLTTVGAKLEYKR